jgi:glycosyltransferase involved in cell wall biosynthesis
MGGGVRRHVVDLIKNINHEKFDVTLLYGASRTDDAFHSAYTELKKYAELVPSRYMLREISPIMDVSAIKESRDLIKSFKPDIVHCHSSKAGAVCRIAAKAEKVPKVFYTPHVYAFQAPEFSEKQKFAYIQIEKRLSRGATTLTFNVSKEEKRCALKAGLDCRDKFKVIYNGIEDCPIMDKSEARQRLGLPENAFVAGVTARLNSQKDPLTFVKIAETFVAEHPDAHFAYIGSGPFAESINTYILHHGLEKNIHLLGYRNDAEFVVSAFDVYLLTSVYEGYPYCLVEALRAGVPLAATKVSGNKEIVKPSINGDFFEAGDVNSGVRLLEKFYKNTPYSRESVRETFKTGFSLRRMIKTIEYFYLA